jgi:hypothetical protein
MNNPSTARNKSEERSGSTGFSGGDLKNKALDAGQAAADKAQDFASTAAHKVQDAASNVAQRASDLASNVGQRADDAVSSMATGMKSLAGTIREHTPNSGMVGTASSTVADKLEGGSRYLQEHGFSGIGQDITNMIRRNPLPALFIGIGIGFLLAQATRSRS